MNWAYAYSPHLWSALISLALVTALGWYSWRRRYVPGAKLFALGCLFAALWALGTVLEISAVDFSSKVFWVKFQTAWQLPTATALPCFVLTYAGLGHWLTRRNLALLFIPSILVIGFILTNNYHNLVWTDFRLDGYIIQSYGIGVWFVIGYAYLLGLANIVVLIWLAAHSPQHRWPVAIMLFGQITGRVIYVLDNANAVSLEPGDSVLLVLGIIFLMYALAFFRFRVFDPIPTARTAALEQMHEGMLVLDLQGRIVDLNPAATQILGESSEILRGRTAAELLPANSRILTHSDKSGMVFEINLGIGKAARNYNLYLTLLNDHRGQELGQLLLLHDITRERQAQEEALEHQQVVATLQERERLARELHDSVGQVLGYVSLQAQTIQKWVQDGNPEKARPLLARLAEVVRDAHADIRESILSLKSGSVQEWSFLSALRKYVNDFRAQCNIPTELSLAEGLREENFDPEIGVQLLRVIQEALTNARKHSSARAVRVVVRQINNQTYITVGDNGCGFDPNILKKENGQHFGLIFMRERMAQIGGSIKIISQPGAGTIVNLEAPVRNPREETQ